MNRYFKSIAAAAVALSAISTVSSVASAEEINLYSYRQPFLIEPLVKSFTEETGIKVNIVFANKGMLEKIKAAGASNPADAVLTVDIGRLYALKQAGVLDSVKSDVLSANIPAHLRDPNGLWFGLTQRARIALVSKERVKEGELKTYEDLADPKFRGRICMRSGKHAYNVALIASMIAHHGEAKTKAWLEGVKANQARKPQGNDRAQAKAVYEGQCDVAISNTYYVGKMQTNDEKPEQKKWAEAVRVTFLNQDGNDRGAHMNISGAGVLKGAKHREAAIKFIEWLSKEKAQHIYAEVNMEYPANPKVDASPLVKSWGDFKGDTVSMEDIAKNREAATKLVDETNFDEGPTS
jgi:iron(III) transport system substrate-binding protein